MGAHGVLEDFLGQNGQGSRSKVTWQSVKAGEDLVRGAAWGNAEWIWRW
jgi:hypothetical protein